MSQAPSHITTVDQNVGTHSSGLPIMELVEICTRFIDLCEEGSWDSLDESQREWWEETLADLHDARVALAECDPDVRDRAESYIDSGGDLEDHAGAIRRAIEYAKSE